MTSFFVYLPVDMIKESCSLSSQSQWKLHFHLPDFLNPRKLSIPRLPLGRLVCSYTSHTTPMIPNPEHYNMHSKQYCVNLPTKPSCGIYVIIKMLFATLMDSLSVSIVLRNYEQFCFPGN